MSQGIFFEFILGMAGGSPSKRRFFAGLDFALLRAQGLDWDSNGRKRVVAFRALGIRPLQTGLTRHRPRTGACQSTFEQCLPGRGTDRPGSILTLAIAGAWQSEIAIRAFPPLESFSFSVA